MGIFKMNHFPISFSSDQKPCLDFDQSCFLMDGWLWPKFRDKCWDPVRQFLKSLRVIKVIKHFFSSEKKLLFFTFALKRSLWVWLLSKITKFGNWIYFTVILDVYDVLINRYITMANLMHNLTVEKSYKLAWITVQNASSACAWNLV